MVLRNRAYNAGAIVAIVSTTALMWSDTAISWWSNIIEFALRINSTATQEVLDSRPSGDADLHALVWGGCAVVGAWVRARVRSDPLTVSVCL